MFQGPLVHNFADHVIAGFDFSDSNKKLCDVSLKLVPKMRLFIIWYTDIPRNSETI